MNSFHFHFAIETVRLHPQIIAKKTRWKLILLQQQQKTTQNHRIKGQGWPDSIATSLVRSGLNIVIDRSVAFDFIRFID